MQQTFTFGQWLKYRRQTLDLTQKAVADTVGCSVDTLRKIESGLRRPSRQIAELLADYLGVPPEEQSTFIRWARGAPNAPIPSIDTPPDEPAHCIPPSLPSQRTSPAPQSSLPIPLTPLIGRERELTSLRALLWRSTTRLVTLTGPPGIGKTRLALAAASTLQYDFKDGLVFVPLASLRDPALVAVAIAQSLEVQETGKQTLVQALQAFLADRQMLLVLDNFEQVSEAAPLISDLLFSSPHLKVFVTSRSPLHLHGEKLLAVPPLSLPDPLHLPPLEDLAQTEAIALFVERAHDANDDFSVTPENAPLLAAICTQLEGLPLAIELAAARTRILSLPALQARLEHSLALLTGGPRDAPSHQQTLRGAIESSYLLLGTDEQSLFRRLGIFVGPFSIEAAEQVTGAASDRIEAILDQSLLRRHLRSTGTPDGDIHLAMLTPIREYALQKLAEHGETHPAALSHARYCLALAVAAHPELRGPNQKVWLDRLALSYDDIYAALRWTLDNGEIEIALRIVGALWWFWNVRGDPTEGRKWLDEIIPLSQSMPAELLAHAYHAAGTLAWKQADLPVAERLLSHAYDLFATLGDKKNMATTLNNLGLSVYGQGDLVRAGRIYSESLALAKESDTRFIAGASFNNLAMLVYLQGDYDRASALFKEGMALRYEFGDVWCTAATINNLGVLARMHGDYERAISCSEETLAMSEEIGNRSGIAMSLSNLGLSASKQGDYKRAAASFARSLPIFKEIDDRRHLARTLGRIAGVAARTGQPAQAARLLGASDAQFDATAGPMLDPPECRDYDDTTALILASMTQPEYDAAWLVGHSMPLDEAVAYALASMQAVDPHR